MEAVEVREYQKVNGNAPVSEWLAGLRDAEARSRIVSRLDRLKVGLLGDWKSVGEGVCELRIDYGPGYRVYYAQDGKTLILLLCGGDKRTQAKDIKQAHEHWKDYKARKPKPPVPSGGSSTKRRRSRRLH
ncbi:MAG: type II toxin-antitoxin system RelE/ParE family toxin [Steroidobacteraceae bacterium]